MNFSQVLSPGQIPDAFAASSKPQDWHENLNVHMTCPDCNEFPPNLVDNFSAGDTICGSCGLVLGERMVDTRSEWRTFANDETGTDDPSRVGNAADPLFYGSQLETHIAWGDGGARNRELHRAQSKLQTDSNNKHLKDAYSRISILCQSIHLTDDALRLAQDIYKQVHDQRAFRGKNASNTIAGCLFIAGRKTKHSRPFKDIADATGVSKKDIGKAFKAIEHFMREQRRTLQRETGSKSRRCHVSGREYMLISHADVAANVEDEHGATDPAELAERYCQELLLPHATCRIAAEVAQKLVTTGVIAGRSPISIAAVAVYFASQLMGQPKLPKEIAAVASVSDGTIRASYKKVFEQRDRLIEQRWLNDGGKLDRLPSS